jgi:AcrR family transcriptional regulator
MATLTPTAPGRPRFTDDDLLDAALGVFGASGYQAAQMSEIAERAATTKPTLYARLGSKDEIYVKVLEREADMLKARLVEAYKQAATLPLHELVKLSVRAFFDFARDRPAGFDLVFRSEPGGPGPGIGRRMVQEVIDHIAELTAAVITRSGRKPGISVNLLAAADAGVAIKTCQYALDNGYDLEAVEALAVSYIESATRGLDVLALEKLDAAQRGAGRPRKLLP